MRLKDSRAISIVTNMMAVLRDLYPDKDDGELIRVVDWAIRRIKCNSKSGKATKAT